VMTLSRRWLVLAIALAWAAAGAPAHAAETYQYDAVGRLMNVAYANGGSVHYTYDANGNLLSIVTSLAATAVEVGRPALEFALGPALPNPGTGPRSISFSTPAHGRVTLRVFDASGRLVSTLVDQDLDPGRHFARFTTDPWGTGVYYYRLEMAGRVRSGRMVVLR
jgi:YD repeat-containing protein